MPAVSPHGAAPPFPHTFMAEWPNLKASPAESIFFPTSTFIIQPNHVSWLLMKVVMRGQNQDALSSTLWEPATPQNLQFENTTMHPQRANLAKRHSPNIENDATEEVPATHLHNTEAFLSHIHFLCLQRPRETKRRFFTRRTINNESKAARVETWAQLKWSGCVDRWHVDEKLRDTDRLVAKVIRGFS